jgi:MFS family permease
VQSVLYAIGDGTFMTASAVFFTQIVGLSAAQIGLGITVAGVVSFLVAVPAGKLADRIGPQRMWALGAVGTGAMYSLWPFINGFAAFLAMSVVLEAVNSAGGAGRGAYVLDVLPAPNGCRGRPTCTPHSTSVSPSAEWRSPSTATTWCTRCPGSPRC